MQNAIGQFPLHAELADYLSLGYIRFSISLNDCCVYHQHTNTMFDIHITQKIPTTHTFFHHNNSDSSSGAIPTRQIITQVRPLQQKVVTSVAAAASTGTQQQFIQQNIQSATGTQTRPATTVIRQQSGMHMYYVVCNSTHNQYQVFLDICLSIQNSCYSYRDNLSFSNQRSRKEKLSGMLVARFMGKIGNND